jgi:small-conductance mechanosensitive channel
MTGRPSPGFTRLAARLGAVLLAAALASLAAPTPATAQTFEDYGAAGPPPEPARAPDLEAYGELAESFRTRRAVDATQARVSAFRDALKATLDRAPTLAEDVAATVARASPTGEASYFAGLFAFLVFLIGIGRAAAVVFAVYAVRPVFVGMQKPNPQGLAEKLPVLAARVGFVIVSLLVTLLVAVLVGSGFYPEDTPVALRTAIIAFGAYAGVRIIDTAWRMILAPYLSEYRATALSDRDAMRLYRWLYAGTLYGIATAATVDWLDMLGLPRETSAILHIVATLTQALLVAAGAWANRRAISRAILGGRAPREASWLSAAAATLWLPALYGYLAFAWVELSLRAITGRDLGPPPLATGFLVLLAGLTVYALTVFAVERMSQRMRLRRMMAAAAAARGPVAASADPLAIRDPRADGGEMDSGDDEGGGVAPQPPRAEPELLPAEGGYRMRSFEDLAKRVASLFALGAAFWALTVAWFGPGVMADDTPLDHVQDVVDILLIGYVLYHAVRIWIDRRIEEEGGEGPALEPGDEGGGASAASRLATLLPLVRNAVLILIGASTALFVATEIGLNVAPVLGGAGIIGLAIGFGSQTLVRDILSGAFFLFDDAFRKGEYIDIGDVKGTVEKISLRSFQLRHHLGALNTVPFGEVRYLTNFSRDWVIMKLPLRLTYDTDPDKVRKLVKKLGERLLEHPEEGRKFLQPLKSQGVYMMEDSAMIIRVKYMTRPGDQWTTRKLVYNEIRELFAREGIKFAHREVTVRIPELDGDRERGLSDAEMRAIGAAARSAVDAADMPPPRPMAVGDDR